MQKLELFEKLEKKLEVNNSLFGGWLSTLYFKLQIYCYWYLVDYHFSRFGSLWLSHFLVISILVMDLQMSRAKMRKVERKRKKVKMRMKMMKEEKKLQKRNSVMMVIIIRFS